MVKLVKYGGKIGRITIGDDRYFQEISQLFSKIEVELKSSKFFKEDVATSMG